MSDWNVMYQLLLCANSTLITFGQLSFLNNDSTSCELNRKNTLSSSKLLRFQCFNGLSVIAQTVFTSTGVVSGTSLKMIMHRL